ncbi:hypothetical protein, partial [Pedobacter sp.]|uniref:hypothetical protein n=1 Tax=Pedobacter sp. TaxID=1411316 RepID=UPI003D7F56E6
AYTEERKRQLGKDIVRSRISAVASFSDVYSVDVVSPAADVVVDQSEVAFCNLVKVNITGYSDE